MEEKEKSEKEKRIRAITQMYYSNPKVQEMLVEFGKNREVVPKYYEIFGKRPDILSYVADVRELVKRGATSFHASEEIWSDPLQLSSDMTQKELSALRNGWDLLIDIDSPFLDFSKIAAEVLLDFLEYRGIKNYGIKFSGSKGFHIIVPSNNFPEEFGGLKTKDMFPEWARTICEYLMEQIREEYNKKANEIITDIETIEKRTRMSKEQLQDVRCHECGRRAIKGAIVRLVCPVCGMSIDRKEMKITKKRLKCLNNSCAGVFEIVEEKEYYYCENCKDFDNESLALSSNKYPENFSNDSTVSAEKIASLDLVLVAPRHLFRMPYSLHEKTALASVVLKKNEIKIFNPKDADPLKISLRNFIEQRGREEAKHLLAAAIDWKKGREAKSEAIEKKSYKSFYQETDFKQVSESDFPPAIKKLMLGLHDGKKRGLFILITFLKALNFPPEYIKEKISEWNKKNEPPLREGYVKSQLDWHFKQKKKILPPNYSNESFYKDLGLIEKMPAAKNPLVEVTRNMRSRK